MSSLKGISARGWLMLARWTLAGTLGCIAVAVTINWLMFRGFGREAMTQSVASAVLIPVVLAGPLFFYLTLKMRELAVVNHKLKELATIDGLTACLNRTEFAARVDAVLEGAGERRRSQAALLVIDADHFKAINDRFGHDQGDEALRLIAAAIRDCVRREDLVGRLGGEEFGVFLPGANGRNAQDIAERIRGAISGTRFLPAEAEHRLSASIGGATVEGRSDFQTLFRMADRRLYEAKAAGRDRVAMSPDAAPAASLAMH